MGAIEHAQWRCLPRWGREKRDWGMVGRGLNDALTGYGVEGKGPDWE